MSEPIDPQRRLFLGTAATTIAAASLGALASACTPAASAQAAPAAAAPAMKRRSANTSLGTIKQVDAGVVNVGYAEDGPGDGQPVILLHGWPYDIHSYVDVAPLLAAAGYRVIVPYLRGYGTTRFLSNDTVRNGQQAAVAHGHHRVHGRAPHRQGDPRRVRLGGALRRHPGGPLAAALHGDSSR